MGLSDEERRSKFHWAILGWRNQLAKLHSEFTSPRLFCRSPKPESAAIVQKWMDELDEINGLVISQTNTNSTYWLLGPNKDTFRSLWEDHYGLGSIGTDDGPPINVEAQSGSLYYYQDDIDACELAQRLTSGDFEDYKREQACIIGFFWDMFRYVDCLLYPVNRYHDDLFENVKTKITRLVGQMANLRYHLVNEYTSEGCTTERNIEQALLCRLKLFHIKLEAIIAERGKDKIGKEYFKAVYEDYYDIQPLINEIGKMTLAEVEAALEQEQHTKYEKEEEYHKEEGKKKPKTDGLFGTKPRSREELETIIDSTEDENTYNEAREELKRVYSTYICTWEERLKSRAKNEIIP